MTPIEMIDLAIGLSKRPGITLCSFGDMLRVPRIHLRSVRRARGRRRCARGLFAARCARSGAPRTSREVVFFAVGFETTAPTTAMAVHQAARFKVPNFSVIAAHVRVPPAIEAILSSPAIACRDFWRQVTSARSWVSSEYRPLVEKFKVPIVVTGFEPVDLLQGVAMCVASSNRAEPRSKINTHAQ